MANNRKFKKLFESGRIGSMHVKNRIVMPAMTNGYGTDDGYVTRQTKDYYEERAKGGVGLVIVEIACVDFPLGTHVVHPLAVSDDSFISGLRELATIIQSHGAKAALQLYHAGGAAKSAITNLQPVGPSPIVGPGGEVLRELSEGEIGIIVEQFAKASKRIKEAGFDGIEVHAAHGYLIAEFLSPSWNKRKDIYGGTLENRARFLKEILQSIREEVGNSYPVWCRINGEESGLPNGIKPKEASDVARILVDSGVNAISVSAYTGDLTSARPSFYPPGWAVDLAVGVKKVVNIPVIAVGRIDPELGEQLLQEGKADFIAIGRGLRADPELPNKVAEGRLSDLRPCIACSVCAEILRPGGQRLCTVNAAIGREREYRIRPAKSKKSVLIVGGGPAGMEAARVAALRGHKVAIWEKGNTLGGQLLLAAALPYKAEIRKFTHFLTNQIEKLGVSVEVNKEVVPSLVLHSKPDVVIITTGAEPYIPKIPGINRRNVITAEAILGNKVEVGERVAVLGGGMIGCEVAEFLAEKGKKVTIIEMLEKLATDMGKRQGRQTLLNLLAAKEVTMLTKVKGEKISDDGLIIVSKYGQRQTIEADTIMLACGSIPNNNLFRELKNLIPEIYIAGDSVKPRTILEAIDEGGRIGHRI